MRNCPFERLAQTHRELVCRANLAFVQGLLQGLTVRGLRTVLDPRPGRCCVALSESPAFGRRRRRHRGDQGRRTWTGWAILAYSLDTLAIQTADLP